MLTPILLASLSNMLSETPKVPVIPHKRELLVFPTSSRSNVDLASSLILHYYFPAVPPLPPLTSLEPFQWIVHAYLYPKMLFRVTNELHIAKPRVTLITAFNKSPPLPPLLGALSYLASTTPLSPASPPTTLAAVSPNLWSLEQPRTSSYSFSLLFFTCHDGHTWVCGSKYYLHLYLDLNPEAQICIPICLWGIYSWTFIGISNVTCQNLCP